MNVDELMDQAMDLARSDFDERVQTLVKAADRDPTLLTDVCHKLTTAASKAGTPEHVAFTYASAAFNLLAGSQGGDSGVNTDG